MLALALALSLGCGQIDYVFRDNPERLATANAIVAQHPEREWLAFAFTGDTLCWHRGETLAMGDSIASGVYVWVLPDMVLYRLGVYDLREPAAAFYRPDQPWHGRPCVKVLASFPPGTRPDTLRAVPAPPPPARGAR